MRVLDVCTGVVTAMRGYSMRRAAQLMWDNGVDALLVIEAGRLRGIITAGDVVQRIAGEVEPDCVTVGSCMTPDPQVVSGEVEVGVAIDRMLELQVRHLPVVDGGRVVGVLTPVDLLRAGRKDAIRG